MALRPLICTGTTTRLASRASRPHAVQLLFPASFAAAATATAAAAGTGTANGAALHSRAAVAAAAASPFPPPPPPPPPKKQQVTLRRTDASSKKWAQLSRGQKVARTASTGLSAITVLLGLTVTGAIAAFVYLEVLAPDSATSWFNRAHDRVRKDPRCAQLLGGGTIKAYGEPTWNRWARNRPIAAVATTDRAGIQHLRIHFNVEGDLDKGVVHLHLAKRPGQSDYEYRHLYLDVAGQRRVYLERADHSQQEGGGGGGRKRGFLGVRWGW